MCGMCVGHWGYQGKYMGPEDTASDHAWNLTNQWRKHRDAEKQNQVDAKMFIMLVRHLTPHTSKSWQNKSLENMT